MRNFLLYTAGFLVLIMLQEFVLSSINLFSLVNIFSYIMIIVMLPMQTKTVHTLICAASVGAVMDIFSGTSALITISIVFVAFLRGQIVKLVIPSDIISGGGAPFSYKVGVRSFLIYTFLMSLIFALVYFNLEMMSFDAVEHTLLRIILSSIATTILIFVLQLPLRERKIKA